MTDFDVAVVGAGGAGLSLLNEFAAAGLTGLRIAVLDPVRHHDNDRTWCFWDGGTSPVEPAVSRRWRRIELAGRRGDRRRYELAPMSYAMVRSADFYAHVAARTAGLDVTRFCEPVTGVVDGRRYAVVRTGAREVAARWVFDSRPRPPARPGTTRLFQHFRGWLVRAHADVFDPDAVTLMDFAVPQPDRGLAFCYVLPLDARRALVEYTQFSPGRIDGQRYDRALTGYLGDRFGLATGGWTVLEVEGGAIPMTDARFRRRAGRRVLRIGTGGGAVRPATGYAFQAIQRQARGIAARLAAGVAPVPPRPYPRRHRWLDAVVLRALDRGLVQGPEFFCRLFAANPTGRVLRFLDGGTSPVAELALMAGTPVPAMLRAATGVLAGVMTARVSGRRPGG